MGGINLNTIRKQQLHSSKVHAWTYRGTHTFLEFAPEDILAGDNWVSISSGIAAQNDLSIFPGDMVIALIDNPGELSQAGLDAQRWKLIRNSGSIGGKLIAESVFYINGGNYNLVTKRLTIHDFPYTFFRANDNVNIKVNSASYNQEAFSVDYGYNEVVWKPGAGDAGFDLEEGDLIEIEVFRS